MHRLLNQIWLRSCRREAVAFREAMQDPRTAQAHTLRRQLGVLASSVWGKGWGLRPTTSLEQFRRQVPLTTPADYRDAIKQIEETGENLLSTERVLLMEPTSGTSGQTKWIPFTPMLRQEFQYAVAAWVHDLFTKCPGSMAGPAYWSISPPLHERSRCPSGIPRGFDDDSAYLGLGARLIARQLFAVPREVQSYMHADDWQYATAWYLLQNRKLAFISVWSPTFLTELTRSIEMRWRDALARDLYDGVCRLSDGSTIRVHAISRWQSKEVRLHVSRGLEGHRRLADLAPEFWPELDVISCWADGASAPYIEPLRRAFPHAQISPKGLLSTEACVSVPLHGERGSVLALRSHFFEFLSADASDTVLADELSEGERYQVFVTTGGGLYRCATGDWIEVVEGARACPRIRFVGRQATSDLVGEKLTDAFVQSVLMQMDLSVADDRTFAMLIPDDDRRQYGLFVDHLPDSREGALVTEQQLADRLDAALRANMYYNQARALGQLGPAFVVVNRSKGSSFWKTYQRVACEFGTRAGDLKPVALQTNLEWSRAFLEATVATVEHS